MRHIILSLSLLIAFPQQTKTIEVDNFRYIPIAVVVGYGIYELVHELAPAIRELNQEQKRKNDLLQESINAKINNYGDPIMYLKTVEQVTKTKNAAFKELSASHTLLPQTYFALLAKNIRLEQNASDNLEWIMQLNNEEIEQFAFLQKYKFTKEDLIFLAALKQRNYRDISPKIIDEIAKKYISSEKIHQSVQPS